MQTISCLVCCREVTVICPSCPDLANQQALLCMPGQVLVALSYRSSIFYLVTLQDQHMPGVTLTVQAASITTT